MFPKGGKFKYDYVKGKPWQYENFYAPFSFAIQKTKNELAKEREEIEAESLVYLVKDSQVKADVLNQLNESLSETIIKVDSILARRIIDSIYKIGFIDAVSSQELSPEKAIVAIRTGVEVENKNHLNIIRSNQLLPFINTELEEVKDVSSRAVLLNTLSRIVSPNISYDAEFTNKALEEDLNKISLTTGYIEENTIIISKGDIVEGEKLAVLNSIKQELESQVWSESNYNWVVLGYTILVALALIMVLLFLRKYRPEIYDSNNKTLLIFMMILFMVLLVTIIIKRFDAKYVYAVPLCALPIILKAFFDARLGLFVHVLTVLLLGFVVPNSFEFIFLHIIAGMVTILTVSELYKRVNLFISIAQITLIYMVAYVAFTIIKEGHILELNEYYFGLFAFNGILAFLSTLLIFLIEKSFGLVSDVSLLELSNTNSALLRLLAEKAPGTFQHSMQVANLAEAAANEIGANAMLVRTGALYHDIGKINNPLYFTENQSTNVNPHDELPPEDSARMIIGHIIGGIELAKKYRLPDRIIDFIRTHHGTSLVYYFYSKAMEANPDSVSVEKFQYPGPIPFSKETAILMMCDAAEAASKSLRSPTAQSIDELIDKIIDTQLEGSQYMNANITFRDIELVKKVLKKKLKNINHLRVEYPE
ncbi:HDIG domain-containing protein [Urechidicola sp. KH5]